MPRSTRPRTSGTRTVRRRDQFPPVHQNPGIRLRDLRHELHGNPRERDAIIRRYARLNTQRHIVRCTPGSDEDQRNALSIGKVTYDTRQDAARCATRLNELGCEGLIQKPYPCGRGEDGGEHWHLTSRDYLDNEVMP